MSNKKFRDLHLFMVDIFVAIQKIKEYTVPFENENDFRHSSLHWDATIRQLEVIGEALNNLLDDENFDNVSPKYFRKVVNFRNTISHGYFGIDVDEVWNVVQQHLKLLARDLHLIINENHFAIEDAIQSSIDEYDSLGDQVIVDYLKWLLSEYISKNVEGLY